MGRTIKLLIYYFAYQLAFMGFFLCGYMIFHHTTELPQPTDSTYITLILLAQVLSTAAVGIHLIVGKYVPLDRKTWAYYNSGKVLIAAILLIVGMGLWSNYLNELADLPNNMQEIFAMMMQHPLGVVARSRSSSNRRNSHHNAQEGLRQSQSNLHPLLCWHWKDGNRRSLPGEREWETRRVLSPFHTLSNIFSLVSWPRRSWRRASLSMMDFLSS